MAIFNRKSVKNAKRADKPKVTTREKTRMGKSVYRTQSDNLMIANEAIYAAVSRIANTVASMPVHLYKGYERQNNDSLDRLLSYAPNPNFTPFGWIQTMEAFRNTEGRAYALIVPDELGRPVRLDILDPTRVTPYRDPDTKEMWYGIMLDDGENYMLPGCQLIVVRHMSANGERGIRPVDVLANTLNYDHQVKQFSVDQLGGVNQGIFLTVPNTGLNREAKDQVIDNFLDAYERSGQRVVVLEGGLQATTFSQSPVNAQVLEVERIMRNRVATVYNIPPHLLGDYSDTSFSTAEQQMQEFLQLTILPIVMQWEQELNRKLLTPEDVQKGMGFRFDIQSLLRADSVSMANAAQMAIRGGWKTPNEVRVAEGLPPQPEGDTLMASRDLTPLKSVLENPEGV